MLASGIPSTNINQTPIYSFPNSFLMPMLLAFLLTASCAGNKSKAADDLYPTEDAIVKYQVDWQKGLYIQRIDQFKKEPIGGNKIVFLGNSLTEGGGNWNEKFSTPNIVNRGISGDITEGVLVRLKEIYYYQPIAVFLLIGINDIFNADHPNRNEITPEYVAQNIVTIADEIENQSPKTEVFIQTVLHVNKDIYFQAKGWFPAHPVALNRQIIEINQSLQDQTKHPVIDLHSAFSDSLGNLKDAYTTDGVHLSEAGYQQWVTLLKKEVIIFSETSLEGN